MSASMLGLVLKDILQAVTPSQKDWDLRFALIADLRIVVQSMQNLRGATVEPFGSFVSNLFTPWSDLDISIELSNGSHISSAGRKHKQMLLGCLLRALKMKGGWTSLQLISNARVPILKFKSNRQSISCDVSIDSLQNQMKSKILLRIHKIDNRFRSMVLLVKEWAKAHKINNSKAGTFNSYALSLLVIFHFQTCVPAILPPFKDIYPGNMVDDLRGIRADAEKLITETCDANINRFLSDKSRPINRKSLPVLFVEFLRKFAQMDSWASQLGICPYTGQWEQIKNNMMWLPKTYAILVEDPFEQPQNTARCVSTGQLKKISKAFLETYGIVTSKNQDQSSLLNFLASAQVSQLIRTPWIPNYSDGQSYPIRPQMQCVMHLPPHPQQRFQNGNQGRNYSNSTSRGPKQIWRQKIQLRIASQDTQGNI
ncbi:protein HESO1-like [Gastrolobium bilobum]|uniref:protein HESO1-like n=1 Tax=Gastrolobium bilobum TaxID=150636 RepID=UPI002AB324F9|nr:protein HESO1-like [Gastrolobium bilobum]